MFKRFLMVGTVLTLFTGCASYVTPGRGADMKAIAPAAATLQGDRKPTDPIQQAFDRKPLAHFPAGVAVVRVQAPGYTSATTQGWGEGQFSIVTTRDVE